MNQFGYEEWLPMVQRVARGIASTHPDVELEDVEGAIWEGLLLYQSKGNLMDPSVENAQSTLRGIGRRYAAAVRRQHLTISPQYGYLTRDITRMLEDYFEPEKWPNMWTPEDADSELGNVGMEMGSDLSRAWDSLNKSDQAVLFKKYVLHDSDVDNKRASRVTAKMAAFLNTYKPQQQDFVGQRVVITNQRANIEIDRLDTH